MKVKLKKRKKSPAPLITEQVMGISTIMQLKNTIINYSVPKKVFFDNYKPTTSKSS